MHLPWRRVLVQGDSMAPTFRAGDRLLVRSGGRAIRPGDVVVVAAMNGRPEIVKRVYSMGPNPTRPDNPVDVRGDNPEHSTDSRTFGSIPRSSIVGRVVRRY